MKEWERAFIASLRDVPLGLGAADGIRVRRWRARLRSKGFVVDAEGAFDQRLRSATLVAQQWAGVGADGLVGPVTWQAVGKKKRTRRPLSTGRNVLRPPFVKPRIVDVRKGQHGFARHRFKLWGSRTADDIVQKLGHYTGGPASFQADSRFHVNSDYLDQGGAPALAYTLGADKDGTLFVVNDWRAVTWHCGNRNTNRLGIVFRGGSEGPSLAQRRTLKWLWHELERGTFKPFPREQAWPRLVRSTTHRHVKSTTCPGEEGERFYRSISARFETSSGL